MFYFLTWLGILAQTIFPSPEVPHSQAAEVRAAPPEIKAIYVTSSTVRLQERMTELRQLVNETELNAIVINTKEPFGPKLFPSLKPLVAELHRDKVWVIARHVLFQDDDLAKQQPELALKRSNGSLWRDSGGRAWVDPANRKVWEYNLKLARQALELGFDEINLDYIRFPTDGDVKNILYPTWDDTTPKDQVLAGFLSWFGPRLKTGYPGVLLSADVFGQTFLTDNDVGMGQRITVLAPHLDVLAPMVYPSHYRSGNFGLNQPAQAPYAVVKGTLDQGKLLLNSSPATIVRPWLQDFNLGATYTPEMVRAQIKATEAAGFTSGWMLWNPKNVYSEAALQPEECQAKKPKCKITD